MNEVEIKQEIKNLEIQKQLEKSNPALYIFMRNDMASLTSGRACAMASHATSQFEHTIKKETEGHDGDLAKASARLEYLYKKWKGEGYFGTTIVLSATLYDIERLEDSCDIRQFPQSDDEIWEDDFFIHYDYVIDQSYRVEDGDSYHVLPVKTCFYMFGDRNYDVLKDMTEDYKIY